MNDLIVFTRKDLLKFSLACLGLSVLIFASLALYSGFDEVNTQAVKTLVHFYKILLDSDAFLNIPEDDLPSFFVD